MHIPKCGGTSVENAIWLPYQKRSEKELWMGFVDQFHNKYQTGGLQHLTAMYIKEEVGENIFDSYFKFAFVRNPFDRIASQFCYIKRRADLMNYIGMNSQTEFKTYLSLIRRKTHVQWMPQYKFIFDCDETLLVDFVGRLETIESDMKAISKELNLGSDIRIEHVNRSVREKTSNYYPDAESIEMVFDLFADDFRLLCYPDTPC